MATLCPMCKAPTQHDFRPFCSKRCRMLDLNNWFKGTYAIPGEDVNPTPVDSDEDA